MGKCHGVHLLLAIYCIYTDALEGAGMPVAY